MKNSILAEPFLVGRERELEELHDSLESANKGEGKTVFISGEAGSGKTRIAMEFLKAVTQKGEAVTLIGGCLSNAATPYFPFIEAFNSYYSQTQNETDQKEKKEIIAWLTGAKQAEKSGNNANLRPQAWKDLTFVAVTNTLSAIAAKETVVLFIEDLHWADSASLGLLHCIARSLRHKRVLLLATFRSDEITSDTDGMAHPLAEELRLMKREGICQEIRLSSLDQSYVTQVAQNMIGGRINPELAEKLAKESQGNALFIVESVRMLSEQGSLHQEGDQWCLSVDKIGIPDRFKEIILRRLGTLKFSHKRILDAASVIGERFDVDLLGAVLVQDSLEVLEALSIIAQSTSLVSVEKDIFRFDHYKSREAIYEEIPFPLRKGYHARVAEKLESRGVDNQLPLSDIAYHFAQAENKEKAVKYSLAAGEDSLEKYSNTEAIRHFKYVLNTAEDCHTSEKIRAQEGLGDALRRSGLLEEATEAFEKLRNTAAQDLVRLRAIRKGMWTCLLNGNFKHSLELSVKAERFSDCDRLEYARVLSVKGRTYDYLGDQEKAFRNKEEALKAFQEECALQDVANSLVELATSYSDKGLFEKALAASLCSTTMYEEFKDLHSQEYALGRLAWRFHVFGFFEEAIENYAKAIRICERIGANAAPFYNFVSSLYESVGNERIWSTISAQLRDGPDKPGEAGFFLSHLPPDVLLAYKKSLKSAISESLRGAKLAEETDSNSIKVISYASLTRQYSKLGELDKAEKFHKKLMDIFDQMKNGDNKISSARIVASKASYFGARKQWKEANEFFKEALALLKNVSAQHQAEKTAERAVRFDFALALARQGYFRDAELQIGEYMRIGEEMAMQKFSHTNLQTFFIAPREVDSGEEFDAWLYIINAGKTTGRIVRIDSPFTSEFRTEVNSSDFELRSGLVKFKHRSIHPFRVEALKFKLAANKAGNYSLNPTIVYLDESDEMRTCRVDPVEITVKPGPKNEVLPGRVPTGFEDLDTLLLGGIPEKYSVALTTPLIDLRGLIVERFLEAGPKMGQTTFFITTCPTAAKKLAEDYRLDFFLFVCNSQADSMVPDLPNIYRLKGIESLTEIDIALTKAFRTLNPSKTGPKRICIDLVSDVLLQHRAVITRNWLSALLTTLKSKGFTVLAVLNPFMHPPEEVQAILGLFEGEIKVYEIDTPRGVVPALRIRRMHNQKYSENELILDRHMPLH